MAALKYSDIETKYKGLKVPDFSINVGGSDVNTDDFPIHELNVLISAGFDMSSCEFKISAEFDEETSKFEKDILGTFKPGKVVIVKMGYSGSALQGVFKGYINSLSFDFNTSNDGAFIGVKCLDAKGALVNNKTWVNYGKDDIKTIVKTILTEKCSAFATISTPESDFDKGRSGGYEVSPEIKENLDDYNYVIKFAEKTNNSFCVINDTLYFSENLFEKNTEHKVELAWGESLLSLVTEIDLSHQIGAVQVYGNDPINQESFSAKAEPAAGTGDSGADMASLVKSKTMVLVNPYIINQSQADAVAKSKIAAYSSKLLRCQGKTIGIPDILAGDKIKLSGMGKGVDGVYSLSHVTHRMDETGYNTFFEGHSSRVVTT